MKTVEVAKRPARPGLHNPATNQGLVKYLRSIGLKLPKLGKYLGHGIEGEVHAFGKDKIIKVGIADLADIHDMINLLIRAKKMASYGCFAQIYDFEVQYKLVAAEEASFTMAPKGVYYIVEERMYKPFTDFYKLKPNQDALISRMIWECDDVNYVREVSEEAIQEARQTYKTSTKLEAALAKVLPFCEGLRKSGFKFTDLHLGNIMVDKSGNMKIIDYGFGQAEPAVTIKQIAARLLAAARMLVSA